MSKVFLLFFVLVAIVCAATAEKVWRLQTDDIKTADDFYAKVPTTFACDAAGTDVTYKVSEVPGIECYDTDLSTITTGCTDVTYTLTCTQPVYAAVTACDQAITVTTQCSGSFEGITVTNACDAVIPPSTACDIFLDDASKTPYDPSLHDANINFWVMDDAADLSRNTCTQGYTRRSFTCKFKDASLGTDFIPCASPPVGTKIWTLDGCVAQFASPQLACNKCGEAKTTVSAQDGCRSQLYNFPVSPNTPSSGCSIDCSCTDECNYVGDSAKVSCNTLLQNPYKACFDPVTSANSMQIDIQRNCKWTKEPAVPAPCDAQIVLPNCQSRCTDPTKTLTDTALMACDSSAYRPNDQFCSAWNTVSTARTKICVVKNQSTWTEVPCPSGTAPDETSYPSYTCTTLCRATSSANFVAGETAPSADTCTVNKFIDSRSDPCTAVAMSTVRNYACGAQLPGGNYLVSTTGKCSAESGIYLDNVSPSQCDVGCSVKGSPFTEIPDDGSSHICQPNTFRGQGGTQFCPDSPVNASTVRDVTCIFKNTQGKWASTTSLTCGGTANSDKITSLKALTWSKDAMCLPHCGPLPANVCPPIPTNRCVAYSTIPTTCLYDGAVVTGNCQYAPSAVQKTHDCQVYCQETGGVFTQDNPVPSGAVACAPNLFRTRWCDVQSTYSRSTACIGTPVGSSTPQTLISNQDCSVDPATLVNDAWNPLASCTDYCTDDSTNLSGAIDVTDGDFAACSSTYPPREQCGAHTVNRQVLCAYQNTLNQWVVEKTPAGVNTQCGKSNPVDTFINYPQEPVCSYQWKCKNSTGQIVDCDTLEATNCSTCTKIDFVQTDVNQTLLCVDSSGTVVDKSQCPSTLPSLSCKCTAECQNDQSNWVTCTDDLAWTISTKCLTIDARDETKIRVTTKNGTHFSKATCVGDCLPTWPQLTQRVTNANVLLCTIENPDYPACSDDGSVFTKCPATYTCDVITEANCPQTLSRQIDCFLQSTTTPGLRSKNLQAQFITQYPTLTTQINQLTAFNTLISNCNASLAEDNFVASLQCPCKVGVWCQKDHTATLPETSSDFASFASCDEVNPVTSTMYGYDAPCDKACSTIPLDDKERFVYCRTAAGVFEQKSDTDKCGAINVSTKSLMNCPSEYNCASALFCQTTNAKTVTEDDLNIVTTWDKCEDGKFYSENCYSQTLDNFSELTCTLGFPDPLYNIRKSQCKYYNANGNGFEPLPQGTITPDECTLVPVISKEGCTDLPGCTPQIVKNVIVPDKYTTTEKDTSGKITFAFEYAGLPTNQGTPYTLSFQWSYKLDESSTNADNSLVWRNMGESIAVVEGENSFVWDVNNVDFDFVLPTSLTDSTPENFVQIFTRAFITQISTNIEYAYPANGVITINKAKNCAAGYHDFTGINETCVDENGVATLKCTFAVTSNDSTPSGPCSRNAVCDSADICGNGGYKIATSESTCAAQCTCTGGFLSQDNCKTCQPCQPTLGRLQAEGSATCGCASCATGLSGQFCDQCSIYATIAIAKPPSELIPWFTKDQQLTLAQSRGYSLFASWFKNYIATAIQFPLENIVIDKASSSYDSANDTVSFRVKFSGQCFAAKESAMMIQAAVKTSPSLQTVDDKFATEVTPQGLTSNAQDSKVAFANADSSVTITSQFTRPDLLKTEPQKEDKGTNVVAIVVPIVVVVVVLAILAVVLFVCCFKKTEGGDSVAASSTKTETPKPKRNNKIDDSAHLELL